MPEITRFATIKELSAEATRVVRVTTKSGSQYTVGLVGFGAHRAVVVRGRGKDGSKIEIQDPMGALENGRSLFDAGLHEWVGQGIDVGSLSTSRIAAVEEVTDVEEVTTFSGLHPRPSSKPAKPKSTSSGPTTGSVSPASRTPVPSSPIAKEPIPVHVYQPKPAPASSGARAKPTSGPVYVADLPPSLPNVSAPSPAVTPVASPARLARRKRSQPLIVEEAPSGPLSLEPPPPPLPEPDPDRTELEYRVLDLEYAAAYLNRLRKSRKVLARLDRHPDLLDRFEAAFSLCTLTVEDLSKNLLAEEEG